MKTNILVLLSLVLASSCATPNYGWKMAPEKNLAQTQADLQNCQRASHYISPGKFGDGRVKWFNNCMYAQGHSLIIMKDEE